MSTRAVFGTLLLSGAVLIVPVGFSVFGWFLHKEKQHRTIRIVLIALSLLFLPGVSLFYLYSNYREELPMLTYRMFLGYYECNGIPVAETLAWYVLFASGYACGLLFLWWMPIVAVIELLGCGVNGGERDKREKWSLLLAGILGGTITGGAYFYLLTNYPHLMFSTRSGCGSSDVTTRIVGGVIASFCCVCWYFAGRGLSLPLRVLLVLALIGTSWFWVEWLGRYRYCW